MKTSSNESFATPASARRAYEAVKSNPTLDLMRHGPLVLPECFDLLAASDESLMPHARRTALRRSGVLTFRTTDRFERSLPEANDVLDALAAAFGVHRRLPSGARGGRPRGYEPGYVPSVSWASFQRFVQWRVNVASTRLADHEPPTLSLDAASENEQGDATTLANLIDEHGNYYPPTSRQARRRASVAWAAGKSCGVWYVDGPDILRGGTNPDKAHETTRPLSMHERRLALGIDEPSSGDPRWITAEDSKTFWREAARQNASHRRTTSEDTDMSVSEEVQALREEVRALRDDVVEKLDLLVLGSGLPLTDDTLDALIHEVLEGH